VGFGKRPALPVIDVNDAFFAVIRRGRFFDRLSAGPLSVARKACLDRSQASHALRLRDMRAKYVDIRSSGAIDYIGKLPAGMFELPTGEAEAMKSAARRLGRARTHRTKTCTRTPAPKMEHERATRNQMELLRRVWWVSCRACRADERPFQ
jgi:hypothetical protein